jgi:hypothetical protein
MSGVCCAALLFACNADIPVEQDADIWRRAGLIDLWMMPAAEMLAPSVLTKLAWDLLVDAIFGGNAAMKSGAK